MLSSSLTQRLSGQGGIVVSQPPATSRGGALCTVITIRKEAPGFLGSGLDNKAAFLFFFLCIFSYIM